MTGASHFLGAHNGCDTHTLGHAQKCGTHPMLIGAVVLNPGLRRCDNSPVTQFVAPLEL